MAAAGTEVSVAEAQARVAELAPLVQGIREQVGRVLVGQQVMVDRLYKALGEKPASRIASKFWKFGSLSWLGATTCET